MRKSAKVPTPIFPHLSRVNGCLSSCEATTERFSSSPRFSPSTDAPPTRQQPISKLLHRPGFYLRSTEPEERLRRARLCADLRRNGGTLWQEAARPDDAQTKCKTAMPTPMERGTATGGTGELPADTPPNRAPTRFDDAESPQTIRAGAIREAAIREGAMQRVPIRRWRGPD